jgi:hypothetical protein
MMVRTDLSINRCAVNGTFNNIYPTLENTSMKFVLKNIILTICASTLLVACATTSSGPMPQSHVDELLSGVPSKSASDRDAMAKEFLSGGEATIAALFQQVVPTGAGDDRAARTALNGIAKYASRPGAEKQRRAFEAGALAALPTLETNDVKAFTIRQLEVAGGDASVETLSGFLGHEALAQPAITVLQLIASPKAASALDNALAATDNISINTALVKALGELRHEPSGAKIAQFVSSEDRALKFSALYALANIGNPKYATTLEIAVSNSRGYDQIEAKSLVALYKRRRAE